MAALNQFTFIGNLGRDPEIRMTPSGSKVASFSVAITEQFKDKDGNKKETTEWVNVVCWRRQADIAEQYLKKGSPIFGQGKLKTQSWEDTNGQKRYKTEVEISHFQMLGKGQGGDNNGSQGAPTPQAAGYGGPSLPPPADDQLPF